MSRNTRTATSAETREHMIRALAAFLGEPAESVSASFPDDDSRLDEPLPTVSGPDGARFSFRPSLDANEGLYGVRVHVYPSDGFTCGECACRCGYDGQNCCFGGIAIEAPHPDSPACRNVAFVTARAFNAHFGVDYTRDDFRNALDGQFSLF